MSTKYNSLKIVKIFKYSDEGKIIYRLAMEDPVIIYLVTIFPEKDVVMFQAFRDKKEYTRSFIDIMQ